MSDLRATLIGQYWKFLTQHYGLLASEKAMTALRAFWLWAEYHGLAWPQPMPADLKNPKVAKPYLVKVKISETK